MSTLLSTSPVLRLRGGDDGLVQEVKEMEMLFVILESAEDKLVVIDFTAAWCGPCRHVAPIFHQLAETHPHVLFLKVDVDHSQDIAEAYDVTAMPTFVFLKKGEVLNKVVGADIEQIKRLVQQHGGV